MKRFIDWLKSFLNQQSVANEAEQAPVNVSVRSESDSEHENDTSFSSSWAEQNDSSIFDTGSLKIEKSDAKSAVSNNTLKPVGASSSSANEDAGVDPYNTGRFDAKNE